MKYEYDRETDILTVILSDEKPDHGEQTENIITHYTDDGTPVQLEILDASETVLHFMEPILHREHDKEATTPLSA